MDSRRAILDALRRAAPPEVELPDVTLGGALPADPPKAFAEALAAVGGACVPVAAAELPAQVRALAGRLGAKRVAVVAPAAGEGDVRLEALADPHEIEGTDLAVVPGVFGVAENGAIWVDTRDWAHRGVFVIAQHLAIVLPAAEIVADMHAAYARVSFDRPGFQLFIAGPSKTADIEQSLVIGAHGARSCTVFLVS
jgi:L-lactate dehydrogenase complex protein LldG